MSSHPVILDAGPSLNFLGAGQHGLLCEVLTRRGLSLVMPETVKNEVENKATSRNDTRFRGCEQRLAALIADEQIAVLKDSKDDRALASEVAKLTNMAMAARMQSAPDLGETMVIAHAMKLRAQGVDVVLLIDEWRGRALAERKGLVVIGTLQVLEGAAKYGLVENRGAMKALYGRLSALDAGLVSWEALPFVDFGAVLHARSTYQRRSD